MYTGFVQHNSRWRTLPHIAKDELNSLQTQPQKDPVGVMGPKYKVGASVIARMLRSMQEVIYRRVYGV